MKKRTIYNDDDMMLYVDEVIELISKGRYYSARMDQIKLACVDKFGDKWLALIEKLLELSRNPEDNDNGVQMIDNTELLENQKHSDNQNNYNDDDCNDEDEDDDYSEITSLNELNEKV